MVAVGHRRISHRLKMREAKYTHAADICVHLALFAGNQSLR
jgi:hypothetical protein